MIPPVSFFSRQQKRDMRQRRDATPLRPDELIALRQLLDTPIVEPTYSPKEVAAVLGYRSARAILDLVRKTDAFPKAFKPRPNVVRIPASDVLAFQEARRVHAGPVRTPAPGLFSPQEVAS